MLRLRLLKEPKMRLILPKMPLKKKYDAVIVFGGDGTVNEVISGISEKNHIPKLGIIPGGTGNLITKILEIN